MTHSERNQSKTQEEITRIGNPGKPRGEEGEQMLLRMNESHFQVTEWALEHFSFQEKEEILDIGCGGGAALRRMSQLSPSGHLTGVDYSDISVGLSRTTNERDIRSGKMEILQASVEQLPFENGRFDKIITVESFYFWPDPAENLKEVQRVLKDDGVFLLVAEIYQKEGLSGKTLENIKQYHLFNPSREEFQSMFLNAGFSKVCIHTEEGRDWICVEGRK